MDYCVDVLTVTDFFWFLQLNPLHWKKLYCKFYMMDESFYITTGRMT